MLGRLLSLRMFKEYMQTGSKEAPCMSTGGSSYAHHSFLTRIQNIIDGEDNMKQIQFKLGELINSISKFENLKPEKVTKQQYEDFMITNNEIIQSVEEIMKKYITLNLWNALIISALENWAVCKKISRLRYFDSRKC